MAWIQRNERHLSTLVFVGGFAGDLIAFYILSIDTVQLLFVAYLALAAFFTTTNHAVSAHAAREDSTRGLRAYAALSALAAQYFIGSLLSGFLIFYTKSGTVFSSWPFLLLLAAIFLGNELFRGYRNRLAFLVTLLYAALYSYLIFAVPVYLGEIGQREFAISSIIAISVLSVYLLLLSAFNWQRIRSELLMIALSCTALTALVIGSYYANLIPPIPLTLKSGGIYDSVARSGGGYAVVGEPDQPWWDPRPRVVHAGSDATLSAFTAISAPSAFTVGIVHEWQRYDGEKRVWERQGVIAFSVTGGRQNGYRGYTTKSGISAGSWRVLVKTQNGQVLGSLRFEVVPGEPIDLRTSSI